MKTFKEITEKISQKQLTDIEKFADKILAKYDIDIEFTKHFLDRLNDKRNDPEILVAELQRFFKKIKKAKGKNIIDSAGTEVILKDIQSNLNLPVVVKLKDGKFIVTHKTIMRKKDFKSKDKTIKYK